MATYYYGKSLKDGKYYFRLKDDNNETILHSNQGYETRQGCIDGIASVRSNSPYDHNYSRFVGTDGKSYFHLNASNGRIIGQSEGYSSNYARDKGVENCKKEAPYASEKEVTGSYV